MAASANVSLYDSELPGWSEGLVSIAAGGIELEVYGVEDGAGFTINMRWTELKGAVARCTDPGFSSAPFPTVLEIKLRNNADQETMIMGFSSPDQPGDSEVITSMLAGAHVKVEPAPPTDPVAPTTPPNNSLLPMNKFQPGGGGAEASQNQQNEQPLYTNNGAPEKDAEEEAKEALGEDVTKFLAKSRLLPYWRVFEQEGVSDMEDLAFVSDGELTKYGMKPVELRRFHHYLANVKTKSTVGMTAADKDGKFEPTSLIPKVRADEAKRRLEALTRGRRISEDDPLKGLKVLSLSLAVDPESKGLKLGSILHEDLYRSAKTAADETKDAEASTAPAAPAAAAAEEGAGGATALVGALAASKSSAMMSTLLAETTPNMDDEPELSKQLPPDPMPSPMVIESVVSCTTRVYGRTEKIDTGYVLLNPYGTDEVFTRDLQESIAEVVQSDKLMEGSQDMLPEGYDPRSFNVHRSTAPPVVRKSYVVVPRKLPGEKEAEAAEAAAAAAAAAEAAAAAAAAEEAGIIADDEESESEPETEPEIPIEDDDSMYDTCGNPNAATLLRSNDDEVHVVKMNDGVVKRLAAVAAGRSRDGQILSCINASLRDAGALAAAGVIHVNMALKKVELADNGMGPRAGTILAKALRREDSAVEFLGLSNNPLGDKGIVPLAEALGENESIQVAHFRNCQIGEPGAEVLGYALGSNTTLAFLNVCENRLGDKGTNALVDSLGHNDTLRRLSLNRNGIGGGGIKKLAAALTTTVKRKECGLERVDLKDNFLGDDGARQLAEALKHNKTVRELVLQNNNIGGDGAVALADMLKSNSTLFRLDIRDNKIGADGAFALAEAIRETSALRADGVKSLKTAGLQMWNNQISWEGSAAVRRAYERRDPSELVIEFLY